MNHYVYLTYETNGRLYIGSRSCECLPEEDTEYMGSFSDDTFEPNNKKILRTYDTREKALQYEVELHEHFDVGNSTRFANKAKQLTNKFFYSVSGEDNPAKRPESRKKISDAMTGDSNPAKRPEVREKLVEAAKHRPPVSDDTKSKMSEAHMGRAPTYGMKGKSHSPETRARMRQRRLDRMPIRYFKSPAGVIHQVKNITRFAVVEDLNPTALSMVANGKRRQHKGWTII